MPSPELNSLPSKLYSTSSSSIANLKRTNEELRKHVAKLKTELDAEKARSKQIHRDKVADIKRLKDQYDQERLKALDFVAEKAKLESEQELKKMKENLLRSKEAEIKQILRFKEEELKTTRKLLIEERENAIKALEERAREVSGKEPSETERKLHHEIRELKREKLQCEELLRQHAGAEIEKSETLRRMRTDHEVELQKIAKENRKEFAKKINEIKSCQRIIQEKTMELARKEQIIEKLKQEKWELNESCSSNGDNSILFQGKGKEERRSSLQASSEYCAKLELRIQDLKRRNGDLVSLARKLEEKGKQLQAELNRLNTKRDSQPESNSLENLKRMYTMQRARDLSEHAKVVMAKEKEIAQLKSAFNSDLGTTEVKRGKSEGKQEPAQKLEDDPRVAWMEGHIQDLEGKLAHLAKEKLILEKDLTLMKKENQGAVQVAKLECWKEECSKLESEKEALRKSLDDLYTKYKVLRDQNQELQERIAELQLLKDQLTKYEEEVDNLRGALDGSLEEVQSLKKTMERQRTDFETLKLEKEKSGFVLRDLQNKTVELQKRVEKLSQYEIEAKDLRVALENSRNKVSSLQCKIQETEASLVRLQTVEQDLELMNRELQASKEAFNNSLLTLKNREEEMTQLLRDQDQYKIMKEKEVQDLSENVELLRTTLSSLKKLKCVCGEPERLTTPIKEGAYRSADVQPMKDKLPTTHANHQIPLGQITELSLGDCETSSPEGNSTISDQLLEGAGDLIASLAASDTDEDNSLVSNWKRAYHSRENDSSAIRRREEVRPSSLHNEKQASEPYERNMVLDESDEDEEKLHHLVNGDCASEQDVNAGICQNIDDLIFSEDEEDTISMSADTGHKDVGVEPTVPVDDSGLITLYTARHNYDPFVLSPNRNPEVELAFRAGDHLYVLGEKHTDGYYLAELMNGKRGFVPSNYLEKAAEDQDLQEGGRESPFGDEEDYTEAEYQRKVSALKRSDSSDDFSFSSLSADSEAGSPGQAKKPIPAPISLFLERQLTNSVVLSWESPSSIAQSEVKGYTVYVDGKVRQTVIGPTRTKALISDVDPTEVYIAAVTTMAHDGSESAKEDALLVIGKGNLVCPSDLEVAIRSNSDAVISWQCINQWQCHAVFLNKQLIKVTPPGVSHCALYGLQPLHSYEAAVEARFPGGKISNPQGTQMLMSSISFRATTKRSLVDEAAEDLNAVFEEKMLKSDGKACEQADGKPQDENLNQLNVTKAAGTLLLTDKALGNRELEGRDIKSGCATDLQSGNAEGEQHEVRGISLNPNGAQIIEDELRNSDMGEIENVDVGHCISEVSEEYELSVIKEETEEDLVSEDQLPASHCDDTKWRPPSNREEKTYTIEDVKRRTEDKTFTISHDMRKAEVKEAEGCRVSDDQEKDLLDELPELPHDHFGLVDGSSSNDFATKDLEYSAALEKDSTIDRTDKAGSITGFAPYPITHVSREAVDAVNVKIDKVSLATHDDSQHSEDDFYSYFKDEGHGISKSDQGVRDESDIDVSELLPSVNDENGWKLNEHKESLIKEDVIRDSYFAPPKEDTSVKPKEEEKLVALRNECYSVTMEENCANVSELDSPQDREANSTDTNNFPTPKGFANQPNVMIRVFVALFSYDPVTMSPNPNAASEELLFRQGELIKVYGDIDDDGFYIGEIGERKGFVPSNMVQEVNLRDFGISTEIHPPRYTLSQEEDHEFPIVEENVEGRDAPECISASEITTTLVGQSTLGEREYGQRGTMLGPSAAEQLASPAAKTQSLNANIFEQTPKKMVALYDYDPQVLSPNVDAEIELGFQAGDIISVYGDMDEDGFYVGKLNGRSGLVPSNFLRQYVELPSGSAEEIEIVANPRDVAYQSSANTGLSEEPHQKKKKKGLFKKSKKIFSKWKSK